MTKATGERRAKKLEKQRGQSESVSALADVRAMTPSRGMRQQVPDSQEDISRDMFERHDSELALSPTSLGIPTHGGDEEEDEQSMDERALRRHFMDVESSFLPDAGPNAPPPGEPSGVDDTYLELGQSRHTSPPGHNKGTMRGYEDSETSEDELETPAEDYKTPATGNYGEDEDEGSEGTQDASPMVAAAQRTHARNHSLNSERTIPTRAVPALLHNSPKRPVSNGSTIRPTFSPTPQDVALPMSGTASFAGSTNGHGTHPNSQWNARSSGLSRRGVSHRSSLSSGTISSDFSSSDAAVGSDYALQTGGAVAHDGLIRGYSRAAHILSRLPSMGSVSSYMEGNGDRPRTVSGALPLDRFGDGFDSEGADRAETPRGTAFHGLAPTDTVLAQRVESIQVPETVARTFRARNPALSPEKRPSSAGGPSFQTGPRQTLTLKEQNGKIDKLTKENFDLKLKIHFLDEALRSRSDDGVKELIDKNVQLQTDLANERKEGQNMRRKIRELERKAGEQEERLAELDKSKSGDDAERDEDDPTLQAEMHEEILYLRQQLDHSENQVTTLREETMTKELEKRKMAEHMRSIAGTRGEDSAGMRETMDMWQDLLNAETGRREQAEEDIRKLREELSALRIDRASPAVHRVIKLSNAKRGLPYEQSFDAESDYVDGANGTDTNSSVTLVGQLKHENAELRRDLGAQTSMLTSRNRERERLQQEIEDLKLFQRKSDGARSVTGESIFERSISRAHQRAQSRASDHTQATHITEAEREEWEKKEGHLRDKNAEVKLKYQELERAHNTHLQYIATLESDYAEMEQELNESSEDSRALQSERDEALHAHEDLRADYEKLELEALAEIDKNIKEIESLEIQLDETHKRLQKTQTKLDHATDGYQGLQGELREITQSVMNLEDEKEASIRTIQTNEQHIVEAEGEIQKWEQKCKELDQKNRKLEITQESLQSEITFLREEQEGDKIKIGELDDALNAAQQIIQDEQEKLREMEDAIGEERQQRDVLENNSREEVQKVLDDVNNESAKTKDEVRKLRRNLSAKEVEASSWKQKLDELEQSLRNALGDPKGTKQTLLAEIDKLQQDLESTATQLDRANMDLADKDRLLRHRDGLLESTSLESRRLSDLLDKERSSRKHDLDQFEKASRGQATNMRTITQQQSRVLELESAYSQDKRKMAALDSQYREQLSERNNLLLALWNRLSTICGTDWAQAHSLVNGRVPSLEVIQSSLSGFSKNLIAATKTIEALLGNFKTRIRSIEKDLWRDYQTLEQNMEMRLRRMEALEQAVQSTQKALADELAAQQTRPPASRGGSTRTTLRGNEEAHRLKTEIKMLKGELKMHRLHPSAMAKQMIHQQVQGNLSLDTAHARSQSVASTTGKSSTSSPARAIVAQLLRHHGSSAAADHAVSPSSVPEEGATAAVPRAQPLTIPSPSVQPQPSEARWVHRLREMERRLKAEREARLLDRKGARQRLEEGRLENEELRSMLEREKYRHPELDEGSMAGGSEVEVDGDDGSADGRLE